MQSDIFYQPHYVAYAAAHGRAPEAQLAADGMRCHQFISWMRGTWAEWAALVNHPRAKDRFAPIGVEDHERFARWLAEKVSTNAS